jgi:hypothetical protein
MKNEPSPELVALCADPTWAAATVADLQAKVNAFKAVPLYIEEPNWSAPEDERETNLIQICVGCGYPGKGNHDGDETCPVAVVERLLCSDCPPEGYPTDKTRCAPCPRRSSSESA